LEKDNMRQTKIIAAVALLTTVVAIMGVTVVAKSSKHAVVAPASSSFSVMQMMKDAKDLPIEQSDAH
jgi:hypothetical protein